MRRNLYNLLLVPLCLLILSGSTGTVYADPIEAADFTVYATHPDAVNQPSQRGRTIRGLDAFSGRLYAGYGDWADDYGPIAIRSLTTSGASWSAPLLNFSTEAVSHFREIGGALYTANLDPTGVGIQTGGYAVGDATHTWSQNNVNNTVQATHVFDINQSSNGDIWMVGSQGNDAKVWRSTDGGINFTESLTGIPPVGPFIFSRYVGVAEYNGNVYVQRVDFNTATHHATSELFNGIDWTTNSPGPDLISQGDGFMFRPEEFAGELVYLSDDLSNGHLYRFDGSMSQHAIAGTVHDFQVVGGNLLVLTSTGELLFTTDLTTWESIGFAPTDARSLELVGDQLFLGTVNAQILVASGLSGIVTVPEPFGLPLLCCLAIGASFRRRR